MCLLVMTPLSVGCASTKMTKAWVYPEHGPLQYDNVMALVLVQDSLVRRSGEDEMVRQIRKAKAVASYTVLRDDEMHDEARVRQAVIDSGVDAIIVMRPSTTSKRLATFRGAIRSPTTRFMGTTGGRIRSCTRPAITATIGSSGSRRIFTTSAMENSSGQG